MRRLKAFFAGWRGLGRFWACILLVVTYGTVTLQWLGPVDQDRAPASDLPHLALLTPSGVAPSAKSLAEAAKPASRAKPPAFSPDQPGRDTPGPVNDPDPALLEPVSESPTDALPRIAPDGRKAMRLYAAGFDASSLRPRVGMLVAGFGQTLADTKRAINDLPGGVSFAVSPYGRNLEPLLAVSRLAGHEYFVSIPMEPPGFPMNDPGPRALMTNLSPEQNLPKLDWILSRMTGYVGATAVLGALRGERFIDVPEQINPVLADLDRRGLVYVDPRAGQGPLPHAWSRSIDLVIDEPASSADIDLKLSQLEALARSRGSALGLATAPRPVTVERIAAWTTGLANRGFGLTPVSALMLPAASDTQASR